MVCPQWLRPFPCSPAVFTAPLPTDPGGAVCLAVALFAFPSRAMILSFVAFCYLLWRNVWSFARCLLGPFGAFCCCCRSSLYILDFVALLFPNICTPSSSGPSHPHSPTTRCVSKRCPQEGAVFAFCGTPRSLDAGGCPAPAPLLKGPAVCICLSANFRNDSSSPEATGL